MKKVFLFLFLFYAKIASAQYIMPGVSIGDLAYLFNKPQFTSNCLSFGFCSQYIFSNKVFGLEANALLYTSNPYSIEGIGGNTYALAPYFFINCTPEQPVFVDIKAGFLYMYDSYPYITPISNISPSMGASVVFSLDEGVDLDFDLTFGLSDKFYTLTGATTYGTPPNQSYSVRAATLNLSAKLLLR